MDNSVMYEQRSGREHSEGWETYSSQAYLSNQSPFIQQGITRTALSFNIK